jgi:glycosyltransferase involved in cell wall biosynthesis
MNILFLYRNYINPLKGGIQRVTSVLADYFEYNGNDVFYLSGVIGKDEEINKKRQHYFPNSIEQLAKENFSFFNNFLINHKIDIVINQSGMDPLTSQIAYEVKKHKNIKLISCVHNSLLSSIINFSTAYATRIKNNNLNLLIPLIDSTIVKKGLLFLYRQKYKKHYSNLCYNSDKVVLLSDNFKEELKFFVKSFDQNKITGISNPTSFKVKEKYFYSKKKQLLYVGRINRAQKKVDLLLKIWSLVYKENPEWSLIVVGDGMDLPGLKDEAIKMNLKRIKFTGYQDSEPYFKEASVFCMTSAFEGFGIVLVEAMQFGTIPVAFESYLSVTDIIDNDNNGFLVKPFDINQYADVLNSLMRDQNKREKMSILSKEKAKIFSIDRIGDRWLKLFNEL